MLSIKGNLWLLCLKKPHPLFMSKKNGSCDWESVCLAWKKCFCGRCFTFEWCQRAKMLSYIGCKKPQAWWSWNNSVETLWGKGRISPPSQGKQGFLHNAGLLLGGEKKPSAGNVSSCMNVHHEGCEHSRGCWYPGAMARAWCHRRHYWAESTSALHIWCWACLPALGHCAISVSMH